MRYNIKQTSQILHIATFLLILLVGIFILISLTPKGLSFIIFLMLGAPIFILAFYLPKFTSIAEIEITLNENGIKRKWVKQFPFQNRTDNDIKWTEIENYIFQPNSQFDKFKLNLKNGNKFIFFHNNNHNNKDDFSEFLNDFMNKVEEVNNNELKEKNDKIGVGKTFYETTYGLIIAIFSITIIISVPTLFIFVPGKGKINSSTIFGFIASSIAMIFFIFQVFNHRKKRKECEKNNGC